MPEQQLDDIIGELQAGSINTQLLDAIKKIAFNTVNTPGDKVPKTHTGEIILKLTFANGQKADTLIVSPSLKTRIPTMTGRGHVVVVEDSADELFFVDPKNGFVSINPIIQDDMDYQERGKVTPINR